MGKDLRLRRRTSAMAPVALVGLLVGCAGGADDWFSSVEEPSSTIASSVEPGSTTADDGAEAPLDETPLDEMPDGRAATVDRVVDGDSLNVVVDGEMIELRLEGFNAPELYADDGGADHLTCNGSAAKEAVQAVLDASGSLTLLATGTDRFGRTLGNLVLDGGLLVPTLINQGVGLATGESEGNRKRMWAAAELGVGVWGDQCPKLEHRLRIGEVQVDAPGNDRSNLADEWVEVVNKDTVGISIDGWVLRDDTTGHQFELSGFLEPDWKLTVRTGGDPDQSDLSGADQTFYLGESFPVWSNSGETVILTDPTGAFVDWRFIKPQ